jgi:hypothetical protein
MVMMVLALAGCAGSGPSTSELEARDQVKQEAIQDILNTPLATEDYSPDASRCLSNHEYRSVDVLDDRHVVFRGSGDRLWVNQLRQRCVGLRRNEVLRFELRNSRVCDLDTFQSLDRGLGFARTSGTCTLGTFMPVTEDQLEAIEIAVRESKQSRPSGS